MNNFNLVGNLTRDVDLYADKGETPFCYITVAQDGGEERTFFFDILVKGDTAKNTAKYCKKGDTVAVSGFMTQKAVELQDGLKSSKISLIAQRVDFLGKRAKPSTGETQKTKLAAGQRMKDIDEDPQF